MEITNIFVRSFVQVRGLQVITLDEKKEWGGYYIFSSDEKNDFKLVWLKPKRVLQLKYHGFLTPPGHIEEWQALTSARIVLGSASVCIKPETMREEVGKVKVINLEPNEVVHIPAGYLHGLTNPFEFDTYVFEKRTSDHSESYDKRESNTKVIFDQTTERLAPRWPEYILDKIFEE